MTLILSFPRGLQLNPLLRSFSIRKIRNEGKIEVYRLSETAHLKLLLKFSPGLFFLGIYKPFCGCFGFVAIENPPFTKAASKYHNCHYLSFPGQTRTILEHTMSGTWLPLSKPPGSGGEGQCALTSLASLRRNRQWRDI